MRDPLDVMSDGSERVRYNRPGFAVFASRMRLSDYPDRRILSHWHDDLEFVLCAQGPHPLRGGRRRFRRFAKARACSSIPISRTAWIAFPARIASTSAWCSTRRCWERAPTCWKISCVPLANNEAFSCLKLTSSEGWQQIGAAMRARRLRDHGGRRPRRRAHGDEPRLPRRGPAHPPHARPRAAGRGSGQALPFPAPHARLCAAPLRGKALRARHRPRRRRVRQRLL